MTEQIIRLENVKMFSRKRNMTLSALADKIGMTYVGLSKLIRENTTTITTIQKIANCLDIPVQALFMSEDELEFMNDFTYSGIKILRQENIELKKINEDLRDNIIKMVSKL